MHLALYTFLIFSLIVFASTLIMGLGLSQISGGPEKKSPCTTHTPSTLSDRKDNGPTLPSPTTSSPVIEPPGHLQAG